MNFEWFFARRYFQGKRNGSHFLSFIKIMAIGGVAVGAGGLLIALSIVHGFKSVIQSKIMGYGSEITVQKFTNEPIFRVDTLVSYLQKQPGVHKVQPVIIGQGMVQTKNEIQGVIIKGVNKNGDLSDIQHYITHGRYYLGHVSKDMPGVVMGSKLARNLDAHIGSVITAYAMTGLPSPINLPELKQFKLTGIYETGIDKFDDELVLMDRTYARELFQMDANDASEVELKVNSPDQIRSVAAHLKKKIGFPLYIQTIYETYSSIFAWINLQEQTIPFVISVMIIVAAFNLIGTILMMVLERIKDIGILKTIGAEYRQIRRLFLIEGLLVAIAGLIIGIGLAAGFNWLEGTYHLIPLSQNNYYMSYAPVEWHLQDFFVVSGVTLLLCTLASWLPARIAAKTDPVDVIAFGR